MEINFTTLFYLFLRLAPFVLVCFFSLLSIFNFDLKGIVYLVGVIFTMLISIILGIYSVIGLLIFPRKVIVLRKEGYADVFPLRIVFIQMGMLAIIFILSGLMLVDFIDQKNNVYLFCLILFLIQSTIAFIRTMFVRVD